MNETAAQPLSLAKLLYMAANPPLLVVAALVLLAGGAVVWWMRTSYKGYGLIERFDAASRGPRRAMIVLAVVYFLVYSYLSVHRYHKLLAWSWDLGIFESLFANALRGDFFQDFRGPFDHFSPAVIIYLPFYALWRDPRVLLVLQTVVLTLAVWPLYLLAKEVTGRSLYGAVAGILYLLYPLLGSGNLHDFHAVALSPLCFFTMLLFMVRERWGWYWVAAAALLLVKEGEPILLFGAGLYLLTRGRRLHGVLSMALAVAWVAAITGVVMPWITGSTFRHFSRYAPVGAKVEQLATTSSGQAHALVLAMRACAVMLYVLLPVGFVVFRRWRPLVFFMLPPIAANFLSASKYQRFLFGHYGLTATSGVIGAVALSLPRRTGQSDETPRTLPVFLLVVAALSNVFLSYPANIRWTYPSVHLAMRKSFNVLSMPMPLSRNRISFYSLTPPEKFFLTVKGFFPEGSSITAGKNLAVFFAGSHRLEDLSYDVEADYYLFDMAPGHGMHTAAYPPIAERLEADESVVRFLDLSTPEQPRYVFFAADGKWLDFYTNAREALAKDPHDFYLNIAVSNVERVLGLPPTVTDGMFRPDLAQPSGNQARQQPAALPAEGPPGE